MLTGACTRQAPASGAKKQKKKWSKGKVKDKAQHAVLLDKTTSEKLYKDVQSYRLVTIATLVDRMKINGSLARQCIADLKKKGIIKPVVTHSKMKIYSMTASTPVVKMMQTWQANISQPAPSADPKLLEGSNSSVEAWRRGGHHGAPATGGGMFRGTQCLVGTYFMLGAA